MDYALERTTIITDGKETVCMWHRWELASSI